MHHVPGLFIAQTEHKGRGIFSSIDLEEGDLIEICPLLFLPQQQIKWINKTNLYDYYFLWPESESIVIALGYGSIYNHSKKANAEITMDLGDQQMYIYCCRPIQAGQEILIDYTGGTKPESELWFEAKD